MTHFLQQSHTLSKNALPPMSATQYVIMRTNYTQTTTASVFSFLCVLTDIFVCLVFETVVQISHWESVPRDLGKGL